MGAGVYPGGGVSQAKDAGGEGPQLPIVPRQPVDVAWPARSPQSSFHGPLRRPRTATKPHGPATRAGLHLAQPTPPEPWDPRPFCRRRGSPHGPAPWPPAPAHLRCRPPAGSLRSEAGPCRAPGPQQPRREPAAAGRAPSALGFSSRRGRRDCSVRVSGRARLALRPPRSPPPRAHLTSRTGCPGRAGASRRVLLNSMRGGRGRGTCRPPRGTPAAGSRGETRRVCRSGRPRVGVGGRLTGWDRKREKPPSAGSLCPPGRFCSPGRKGCFSFSDCHFTLHPEPLPPSPRGSGGHGIRTVG